MVRTCLPLPTRRSHRRLPSPSDRKRTVESGAHPQLAVYWSPSVWTNMWTKAQLQVRRARSAIGRRGPQVPGCAPQWRCRWTFTLSESPTHTRHTQGGLSDGLSITVRYAMQAPHSTPPDSHTVGTACRKPQQVLAHSVRVLCAHGSRLSTRCLSRYRYLP